MKVKYMDDDLGYLLDKPLRDVSGFLCEKVCEKIASGRIPIASLVIEGTCEDLGPVKLEVVLSQKNKGDLD